MQYWKHFQYIADPYSNEQRYDEMCAGPGYGDHFGSDSYRKGAPPVTTDYRDQRSTPFQQPGSVLMVYGLDPLRTNADKLFNLMCLYGNVARVSYFLQLFIIHKLNNNYFTDKILKIKRRNCYGTNGGRFGRRKVCTKFK